MGFYKFVDRSDVNYFTELGSIQFTRLQYYRILNLATGDWHIGDLYEATKQNRIKNFVINKGTSKYERDALASKSFVVDGNAIVKINDCYFRDTVDCYVCSFSEGALDKLVETMCTKADPKHAYDAYVELINPYRFEYSIKHLGISGASYVNNNYHIELCRIKYEDIFTNKIIHSPLEIENGDPRVKDNSYKNQQEWRIILYPREKLKPLEERPDRITVTIPNFKELFTGHLLNGVMICRREISDDFQAALKCIKSYLRSVQRVKGSFSRASLSRRLNNEEYKLIYDAEKKELERLFESAKKSVIEAYWVLRRIKKSDRVDLAFLEDCQYPSVIDYELQDYIDELKLP